MNSRAEPAHAALTGAGSRRWKHYLAQWMIRQSPRLYFELLLATRNHHIEPELWLTRHLCRRDHIAIDVGANEGLFSLYFSKHSRSVIAIEPNPDCAARLARLLPRNVRLLQLAASDRHGIAELRFDPMNTGVGTIEPANNLTANPGVKQVRTEQVRIAPLDDLATDPVAFVKIDVEGHELSVLGGATRIIANDRPSFLIEVEQRHNPGSVERVASFMSEHGYRGFFLRDETLHPIETFTPDLQDLANLFSGRSYVYNFMFLPAESSAALLIKSGFEPL